MPPIPSLHYKYRFDTQSTHRVTIATFWRTFHQDGTPSPFHSIYTIPKQSCGVCSSWEGKYTPLYFSSTPTCTLWFNTSKSCSTKGSMRFLTEELYVDAILPPPHSKYVFSISRFFEICKRFGGTMLLLLLIYYLRHTEIHSFIRPKNHHIRWGPLIFLHCSYSV